MSQLPHIVKTKRGQFRYRRRVPDALREELGKSEIVISLRTADPTKVTGPYSRVHAETERLFAEARSKLGVSDDLLFEQALLKLRASGLDTLTNREDRLDAQDYLLAREGFSDPDELSQALEAYPPGNAPTKLKVLSKTLGILSGTTVGPRPTLSYCLKVLLEDKGRGRDLTKKGWQNYERERKRIVSELIGLIGDREITDISRQDARRFLKTLEHRYKPASQKKQIAFLSALTSHSLREMELKGANPFERMPIAVSHDEDEDGVSFTYEEVRTLLANVDSLNDELQETIRLLACTGARLSEITGLELRDVDPHAGVISLRFNDIRRLKNKQSVRTVPVVDEQALMALRARWTRLSNQPPASPFFPRYGRDGGGDSASAALSKWLTRIGLRDPKAEEVKTTHSLRHTFKDALREANINRDVANMIQGHTAGDAASGYGSSELIAAKRDAAQKVWALYGIGP